MCFWREGSHGGDWKCAHLRCLFRLRGVPCLLLVLMAVLGAAPLSTRRAGPCSWPSPLPAPRDWGVSANSLPRCSCLTIRHFTFGSGWAVPAGEPSSPSPRWPGAVTSRAGRALSPVEPSPRAVAASLRHSCRAVLWTVYLSPTSFPPSSVCARGARHKSTKCM